ncbi:MAG: hypothetical protein HQL69_19405 [Magnetococcales bacterium]|nr:hypothetical protein [Magnetococcales bacterium]
MISDTKVNNVYKLLKIIFKGGVHTFAILIVISVGVTIIKATFTIEYAKMVEIVIGYLDWFVGLCTGYLIFGIQDDLKKKRALER